MAYNSKDTEGVQQNIFTLFHGPCISGAIFISFKDMQQLGDGFFLYLVLHNLVEVILHCALFYYAIVKSCFVYLLIHWLLP